jgi:hypothetical protein
MKWLNNLPEWILGIIGMVTFLVLFFLVVEVYWKFQIFWVWLWLSIPIIAYFVYSGKLDDHLTEKGIKSLHIWLMAFAVGMSLILFFDYSLKEKFGHYFLKGSKFFTVDSGNEDEDGNPVILHEYFTPTVWGRFVLGAYDWIKWGLCFLFPYILHKSFKRSIDAKERKREKRERLEYPQKNQLN